MIIQRIFFAVGNDTSDVWINMAIKEGNYIEVYRDT